MVFIMYFGVMWQGSDICPQHADYTYRNGQVDIAELYGQGCCQRVACALNQLDRGSKQANEKCNANQAGDAVVYCSELIIFDNRYKNIDSYVAVFSDGECAAHKGEPDTQESNEFFSPSNR